MKIKTPFLPKMRLWIVMIWVGLALAACGFAPRGKVQLPFQSIYINFPENAPFAVEIKRQILASSEKRGHQKSDEDMVIAQSPQEADLTFHVVSEARNKSILSLNNQGRVREFALHYVLQYRATNKAGKEVLPTSQIQLKRNLPFNEAEVMARDIEENLIYREMQQESIRQIIRRLSAIKMDSE